MTPAQFLKWESKAPGIDFKVEYVDVAGGDVEAGLLLSQILYWCLPSKTGRSKLTVERDGRLWIAKELHEWYRETRLKRAKFNGARQVLASRSTCTRSGHVLKSCSKSGAIFPASEKSSSASQRSERVRRVIVAALGGALYPRSNFSR